MGESAYYRRAPRSAAFAQETAQLTLAAALERLPQSPDWQIADLTYAACRLLGIRERRETAAEAVS